MQLSHAAELRLMMEFKTIYEDCKRRGIDYKHPLGKLAVVGTLVESWLPGPYMKVRTVCPSMKQGPGYQVASGWYMLEGRPPLIAAQVPWFCSCVRAEPLQAEVTCTLLIRDNAPAILDGQRGLIWPDKFQTVDLATLNESLINEYPLPL